MRWMTTLALALVLGAGSTVLAGPPKIVKVLPHRLDRQGRHTLSPSLYERDAYQAWLRAHPAECSGLQFDVNWKAPRKPATSRKLRLELRMAQGDPSQFVVLETAAKLDRFGGAWSKLVMDEETFRTRGEVKAWRVSLWEGERLLAEQKSFLW